MIYQTHIPTENLRFTGDEDVLELYNESDFVCYLVRRPDGDFDVADKDMNVFASKTVAELMPVGDFKRFVVCVDCKGEGEYMVGPECMEPASSCCGGCYVPVECACEDVIFEL